ncbi:hypothetical protein [Nonomuraea sp. NPDC049646]|uniref:hypothetical protein n=1 Tax=unclassified Nonomuraea TaxID=2593643 RepID=UPI0037945717
MTKQPTDAVDRYYVMPGGAVGQATGDGNTTFVLPDGAREINAAEYETALADLQAAHERYVEELHAADTERQRQVYEALIAVGVSDQAARHLSGYTDTDEQH